VLRFSQVTVYGYCPRALRDASDHLFIAR